MELPKSLGTTLLAAVAVTYTVCDGYFKNAEKPQSSKGGRLNKTTYENVILSGLQIGFPQVSDGMKNCSKTEGPVFNAPLVWLLIMNESDESQMSCHPPQAHLGSRFYSVCIENRQRKRRPWWWCWLWTACVCPMEWKARDKENPFSITLSSYILLEKVNWKKIERQHNMWIRCLNTKEFKMKFFTIGRHLVCGG